MMSTKTMNTIFTIAIVLLAVTYCEVAQSQNRDEDSIVPLDDVQRSFRDIEERMRLQTVILDFLVKDGESLTNLIRRADGDELNSYRQWFYYFQEYLNDNEPDPDVHFFLKDLPHFMEFSAQDIASALYPFLETTDAKLHGLVSSFLGEADWKIDHLDFGIYGTILREKLTLDEELPTGLIEYMFKRNSGHAILEVMQLDESAFSPLRTDLKLQGQRSDWPVTIFGRLVIDEPRSRPVITSALDQLSNHEQWWMKLAVAEFIMQVPELDTPALRARLSQSEHPLVKKALADSGKTESQTAMEKFIVPIDDVQRSFRDIMKGMALKSLGEKDFAKNGELVTKLMRQANGDGSVLYHQWFYYYYGYYSSADYDPDASIFVKVLPYIIDISRQNIAIALYPLLETTDKELHKDVSYLLPSAHHMPDDTTDYGVFGKLLKEKLVQGEELPIGLVQYMFKRNVGAAILEIMLLDEEAFAPLRSELGISDKRSEWPLARYGDLIISESHSRPAISSNLHQLSKHEKWWMKLAVAEFIKQVPELDTPALRARLNQSDHPLVKKALAPIDEKRK